MKSIEIHDYQKEQLERIQHQYNDRLKDMADVVGHLLHIYDEAEEFYLENRKDEELTREQEELINQHREDK